MSKCQILTVNFYIIPIGNVKELVPKFFYKGKYMLHCKNLQIYLRLRLKLKKIHHALEFNQSQWLKPYIEFSKRKKNRTIKKSKKNNDEKHYAN